jgi:hypothetical protein
MYVTTAYRRTAQCKENRKLLETERKSPNYHTDPC